MSDSLSDLIEQVREFRSKPVLVRFKVGRDAYQRLRDHAVIHPEPLSLYRAAPALGVPIVVDAALPARRVEAEMSDGEVRTFTV